MAALVLFCAGLLAASALHKALARERLAQAAARLAGVGAVPGLLLLVLAGALEVVAAACLLAPPVREIGAVMAALVWGAYALALARRRGETLDCGCDLAARAKPVTTAQVLRAGALAMIAGWIALMPAAPFTLDAPFAAAGLLALYLGASELLAIPAPHWRHA